MATIAPTTSSIEQLYNLAQQIRESAMKKLSSASFMATVALLIVGPFGSCASADQTFAVFTKSLGNPISKATRAGVEIVAKANNFKVFNYVPTSPDNAPQPAPVFARTKPVPAASVSESEMALGASLGPLLVATMV